MQIEFKKYQEQRNIKISMELCNLQTIELELAGLKDLIDGSRYDMIIKRGEDVYYSVAELIEELPAILNQHIELCGGNIEWIGSKLFLTTWINWNFANRATKDDSAMECISSAIHNLKILEARLREVYMNINGIEFDWEEWNDRNDKCHVFSLAELMDRLPTILKEHVAICLEEINVIREVLFNNQ